MNPDGVSYLDIGDAYWRGDWHHAINAYWSPLYSWLLGFFFKLLKPSIYWELPIVHLVNFLIFVSTIASFDSFLRAFVSSVNCHRSVSTTKQLPAIPNSALWVLGYSLFLSASLILIGVYLVTPDLCVAAFVYLASALFLRLRLRPRSRIHSASFGLVLGLAFLAKTIMLPVGIVFLAAAYARRHVPWASVFMSLAIFSAIAIPYVALISHASGHITVGESGRWNYLVFVDGVRPFFPQNDSGIPQDPKTIGLKLHRFPHAIGGTYPPWYDPSYWQKGVSAQLNLEKQLLVIKNGLRMYRHLLTGSFLHLIFTVAFVVLVILSGSAPRLKFFLLLAVPLIAALIAYDLLIVEYRYVGGFMATLWLLLFGALGFTSAERRRLARNATFSFALIGFVPTLLIVGAEFKRTASTEIVEAAANLQARGLRSSDPIALIWNDDWQSGAAEGAFVPRLLRCRVFAEAEPARAFWEEDRHTQERLVENLFASGARVILVRRPPNSADLKGWEELGKTEYYGRFR